MAAFMKSTFFNKRTNKPDNGTSDERKQVVDKESPTSKDKSHGNTEESLVEDEDSTGTDTDVVTDPKVTTNNVDKGTNIQDNRSREPSEKDENNTDTDNSNISSEQFSLVETDPIVSPDNDEEEYTNEVNINELLTSDDEENNIVNNINPILMNMPLNH